MRSRSLTLPSGSNNRLREVFGRTAKNGRGADRHCGNHKTRGISLVPSSPRAASGDLEHFSLMLTRSLRVGGNWRILPDKLFVGANEFCARGSVSFARPLFAAVLLVCGR